MDRFQKRTEARHLAAFALALVALSAQAAAYNYRSGPATFVSNSNTCAAPYDCGQYALGEQVVAGSFTTATPLAPNLVNANIIPNLTGYSFNGGRLVIDSGSPASRVSTFRVWTDASGAITSAAIGLHRWTYSAAGINLLCLGFAIGTSNDGTADTCLASGADSFGSSGIAEAGGLECGRGHCSCCRARPLRMDARRAGPGLRGAGHAAIARVGTSFAPHWRWGEMCFRSDAMAWRT